MIKRFSGKTIILLLALFLAAGLSGILFFYGQLSHIGERDVLYSLSRATAQTAENLNTQMSAIEELMQSVLFDARLQESVNRLEEEETRYRQLAEIRPLRELVSHVERSRSISHIRIYLNDEKMITREGVNFFGLTEAVKTPEYEEMSSTKTALHWIGAHEVKTTYFHETCMTLGSLYRNSFHGESRNWAMVLMDISPKPLMDILEGLERPGEYAGVALVDQKGNVMLGNGEAAVLSAALSSAGAQPWGMMRLEGEEWAYAVQPLKSAGWSLVLYMPRAALLRSQQTLRTTLTSLLFGLTLLMIALAVILSMAAYSRSIDRYIRALHESLKAPDHADGQRLPARSMLFNLDRRIAELLGTNRQLAEEAVKAQLREREVTLQALQAQINPHFLYNTLDSINWMAIRDGAEDVSEAITTLADYFRLSLSKGRSVVTLEEDAEIVRKYLTLYEHRYDYEYQVVWSLEKDTMNCLLPKLTLQPLIENALQHGVFKRAGKQGGRVCIHSERRDGKLVLTVSDNGPGIGQTIDWNKGYGLGNVRRRLDLYFNNRYALSIANGEEGGAVVTVQVSADIRASGTEDGAEKR